MPDPIYLTKSDFKVARECPTKLSYEKQRLPSKKEDDPYLAFLADGGFMVETMARALFPAGVEMGDWDRPEQAFEETRERILDGDGVWFEATVIDEEGCLARIDVLKREGRFLDLIEIKSASSEPVDDLGSPFRGARGGILAKWVPYLEDVTFQTLVLERCFPGFEVRPFLCVVDKGKVASANTTFDRFRMVPPPAGEPRWNATFEYLGDPEELASDHLLAFIPVSGEVAELRDEVERARMEFAGSLRGGEMQRLEPPLGQHCKGCEYRTESTGGQPSGFERCWGRLAGVSPHILDLYRVDLLGGRSRDLPAELAGKGEAGFDAIPEDAFSGSAAERQRIQISHTSQGREWLPEKLRETLRGHVYPLHFIDFESSRLALPYHEGMHPYEQVGFQWSCHTIDRPGGSIRHREWLNDEEAFPNFEFGRTLRDALGENGTVYIWSPFEITMLKDIREQMDRYGEDDRDLASWLEAMIAGRDERVIDLCALARESYFHPDMNGRVSIKAVFPAVWRANPEVRRLSCFRDFGQTDDPYQALPPLPVAEGEEEVVREGTGAIRIYQDLMFGLARAEPATRRNYRKLLLQYCHLDTAAMVAIWWHWAGVKELGGSGVAEATSSKRRGWFGWLRG